MTTGTNFTNNKPIASQLIAEFCGNIPAQIPPLPGGIVGYPCYITQEWMAGWGIKMLNPAAMSQAVIKQLATDHTRSLKRIERGLPAGCPPLLDTPCLPANIQQLIVSYLDFNLEGDCTTINYLCGRTEGAFLRHLQAIIQMQQSHKQAMRIEHSHVRINDHMSSGAFNQNDYLDALDFFPKRFIWETQTLLQVLNSTGTDENLDEGLTKFNRVEILELRRCPNLFTLKGLSQLENLRKLTIDLPQLQNSSRKDEIPLKEWDLANAKPNIPCFDFATLKLPKLETLDIICSSELRTIDLRNCKNLKDVDVRFSGNMYDVPRMATKIVDIRGLNCAVRIVHKLLLFEDALLFQGEKSGREWVKVLKE